MRLPVASLVAIVAGISLLPFHGQRVLAISAGQTLRRRQVSVPSESSVPSQCTSNCNPVNDEIALGCPVTACCTTNFEQQYYNCLECIGTTLDGGNFTSLQNNLNLLYTTCVDSGYVLPRMALPGQTASGSNSTTAGHPASTSTPLSTGQNTPSTGAAISGRWYGPWAEALIGTGVLLGVAGMW